MNNRISSFKCQIAAVCIGLFCLLQFGCQQKEEIRIVNVPKSRSQLTAPHLQETGSGGAPFAGGNPSMGTMNTKPTSSARRMFAAMIRHKKADYFFKAFGDPSAIEKAIPGIRQIVKDLTFDNDQIKWVLPEGWKEVSKQVQFRMATLVSPEGTEIAISALAPDQDVLMNINRWQGQLGLPSLTEDQLKLEEGKVGDVKVLFYDQSNGKQGKDSSAKNSLDGTSSESKNIASFQVPFVVSDPPGGWKAAAAGSMAMNVWEKDFDGKKGAISIYKFSSNAGFYQYGLIWAGKLKLGEISEEQFEKATGKCSVAGIESQIFKWPAEPEKSEMAISIIRVTKGANSWYIKLEGPGKVVSDFQPPFEEWAKNLKPTQAKPE